MNEINIYKTEDFRKTLPKLVESIIAQDKRIYLLCDNSEQEKEIDYLLWSYSQLSFIPHGTTSDPYLKEQKVLIGSDPYFENDAEIILCTRMLEQDLISFFIRKYKKTLVLDQHSNEYERLKELNITVNIIKQESGKWIKCSL